MPTLTQLLSTRARNMRVYLNFSAGVSLTSVIMDHIPDFLLNLISTRASISSLHFKINTPP